MRLLGACAGRELSAGARHGARSGGRPAVAGAARARAAARRIAQLGFALCEADPRRDLEAFADTLDAITASRRGGGARALAPMKLHPDYRAAVLALVGARAMNAIDPDAARRSARLDADGRLVDAEPRLFELNARAGGGIGLAAGGAADRYARAAGAAAGDRDLAQRDRRRWRGRSRIVGARRARGGRRARSKSAAGGRARHGARRRDRARRRFLRGAADWLWETDASLRITLLSIEAGARYGFDAARCWGSR